MKKINICIFLCFLFGIAFGNEQNVTLNVKPKILERNDVKKAKAYLKKLKKLEKAKKIYYGEGCAKIKDGEFQGAKNEARKNANNELSGKIKTKIKAEVNIYTKQSVGAYSKDVEKNINQKVMSYTEAVLSDVEVSDTFVDYPQKGYITIFVSIDRNEYDKKVKEDMAEKINMIRKIIISADNSLKKKDFVFAIKDYVLAKELLVANFEGISIFDKIYTKKKKVYFRLYINRKLAQILPKIEISLLDKNFVYDFDGKIISSSKIYVQYSNNNKKRSVSGIPLKVQFVTGSGTSGKILSNEYGEANLDLTNIDAKYNESVIKLDIDKEKLGLGEDYDTNLNSLKIVLKRKKTVAVNIIFMNGSLVSSPAIISERIKSKLLAKKYNVIFKNEKTVDALKNKTINADFLIFIELKAVGGGNVGRFKNMFTRNCTGSLALYKLPQFTSEISEVIKSKKGFGNSLSNAGFDAFGKVSSSLLMKFDSFLLKIE